MIDYQQIQIEYAKSFMDKSRIYFIEKYLSTFNATAGRLTPFMLFPRQKVFLKSLQILTNGLHSQKERSF